MTTHTNPELEARILANPDDVTAYLVYSDWLSERGDPRGELIAVQAKLAESPADDVLRLTEAKLLADHAPSFLGDLAGKAAKDIALGWRLGFLESVRLGPIDDYETYDGVTDGLRTLLELPGTTFVREIVLGSIEYDDYPTSWQPCLDVFAERGVPKGLRRLELNCGGYWDISSTELGLLEPLYPRLADLHALKIRMGAMELGTMALPSLRDLEIVTGGLTRANLESIGAASWPNLERLSLCIGEEGNDYHCDVAIDDVAALLARDGFRRVRHLGLANYGHADQLPDLLLQSRLLPQLETLDLSRGTFSDQGARVLVAHAELFKHLKSIDLTRSYLSDALIEAVAELGPKVNVDDRQLVGDDHRYVQISE